AAGVEARNEGVPVDLFDLDVVDTEVVEDLLVHGDGRTGRLAVLDPGVGLFGGDREGDRALFLRPLERRHVCVATARITGRASGEKAEGEGSDRRCGDPDSCRSLRHDVLAFRMGLSSRARRTAAV